MLLRSGFVKKETDKDHKITENLYAIEDNNQSQFNNQTIDINNYYIRDVDNDNSCFYRSIILSLYYISPNLYSNLKYILTNNRYNVGNIVKINDMKSIDNLDNKIYIEMCKDLQEVIRKWVIQNYEKYIEEVNMRVIDFLKYTHNLEMYGDKEALELYSDRYKYYSGDEIEFDKDLEINDRWGGSLEQYVVSAIFKLPVVTYVAKKYNKTFERIENGKIKNNRGEKGVRLELYQIFGGKYLNSLYKINILYRIKEIHQHYMCLLDKEA